MTQPARQKRVLRAARAGQWLRAFAAALGVFVMLEVIAAAVLSGVARWSWQDALDAFVVTNSAIGMSFGICGAILAWHRPRNPIGWLFAAGGVAYATAALAAPLGVVLREAAAPMAAQRLVITIFVWSWPLAIGLVLPLTLLLFPDGRPPTPRWRWVVIAVIVTAPLFSLEMGTFPDPIEPGYPIGYLTIPFYESLGPLWTAAEIRTTVALFLGAGAVAVRYRRGSDVERRQLLWLLLAVLVALIVILPWGLVAGTPVEVLFAIPLIPIAVTVAIVRHQLLDIRLVVSRVLAWLILLLAVVVVYAGLVALLDHFATPRRGLSALVTVLLVLLAAPSAAAGATACRRRDLRRPWRPGPSGVTAWRATGNAGRRTAGSGHDCPFGSAAALSRDRARGQDPGERRRSTRAGASMATYARRQV